MGYGDDLLIGGLGNDSLIGGDGSDTASYSTSSSAVSINLLFTKKCATTTMLCR